MFNLDKREINFIGKRKIFLIISAVLLVLSVAVIGFKGLQFGTEFTGGSAITYLNVADKTEQDVRNAFQESGYTGDITVQTMESAEQSGFLAQISTTDVQEAEHYASSVASSLGVSSENTQISTIGPNWGADVVQSSALAFAVSLLIIIAYIWIRFKDYKMGVTAVIALLHDLVIVVGIYALVGREVTPNAVAALLTIMGYSLYDTIVVFHRINDNVSGNVVRHSFWTVANHSINQVLTRTINTTLTSLVPVLAMLFFGGSTLQDFAFAMSIGLVCGSYSSIAIAAPIYAYWKQREPKYDKLSKKYGNDVVTDTKTVLSGLDTSVI